MTTLWIAIGILVLLAALTLVGVAMRLRKRGMSAAAQKKVRAALASALSQQDPVRKILAIDTVLDLALTELGFTGSLGEKLQKAAPRFKNLQSVWDAHKLRNRLAHEHDARANPAEVDRAVASIERAILSLSA